MKKRLVNNIQQEVSKNINKLIKSETENNVLNESIHLDKKGKYPINTLGKINKIAKFRLAENAVSVLPKNIKIAEFDVDLNAGKGWVVFFILPNDEQFIESHHGRTTEFLVQEIVDYLTSETDVKITNQTTNNPESANYFDFDEFWNNLNNFKQVEELKDFLAYKIKQSNVLPELT